MVKEKDYPFFCFDEGKEKFERFVRDFNITAPTKLPRKEKFRFWREDRHPGYEKGAFDHISFWKGYDKQYRDDIYYVVSQCYGDLKETIKDLQNDMQLRYFTDKWKYKITVYDNDKYNWYDENMVFIVFQLNEPLKSSVERLKEELPSLKITVVRNALQTKASTALKIKHRLYQIRQRKEG